MPENAKGVKYIIPIFMIGIASYHKPETMPPVWQFGMAYVIWPIAVAVLCHMIVARARAELARDASSQEHDK